MADITGRNQGNVEDSGKVNWRGDQVSASPGQSVYETASVQLADLGARKVVGDRVFRYALADGAAGAGDLCQSTPKSLLLVTGGTVDAAGGKIFTFYFATSNSADVYTEGYLHCQSGTAANLGYTYRIQKQPIVATTSEAELVLYDPLKIAVNVADKWSIHQNKYRACKEMLDAAGTSFPVGVAPVLVASGDYFWLQTWGPCAIKGSAIAGAGHMIAPSITGQIQDYIIATTAAVAKLGGIGFTMQTHTASQYGMTFLQIAP